MTPGAPTLATLVIVALTHSASGLITKKFDINHLPDKWQIDQIGTNNCTAAMDGPTSMCQTLHINSLADFCLWGPPTANSEVATTEENQVAYCTKAGHGTRLIPPGAIKGAHLILTPDFIQITGYGDLTPLSIQPNDEGGELDPHGADQLGNPRGGLVYSSAFGGNEEIQLLEWTNFMSASVFCIRACKPGPKDRLWCQHIYDEMGCDFNMPGNYNSGFDTCRADSGLPAGIYPNGTASWGSTFSQGQPATPSPHPAPSSSSCVTVASLAQASPLVALNAKNTTAGTNSSSSPYSGSSANVAAGQNAAATASSTTSASSSASSSTTKTSGALTHRSSAWVSTLGAIAIAGLCGILLLA